MTASICRCEQCGSAVAPSQIRELCPACYRQLHQALPGRPGTPPVSARPDQLLSSRQAAALLGLQPDSLRRYVRDGLLRGYELTSGRHPNGRRYRFRRSDVLRLLVQHRPDAPPKETDAGSR